MTVDVTRPVRRGDLRNHVPSDGGARWPIARVFAVGAAVAALVSIAAILAGGLALLRLTDARGALLDDIGPAAPAAQRLSVALLDQETGVRGFGLARRDEFLDPYRLGLVAEQEAVGTLRNLASIRGLPEISPPVDAVETAAQAWRTRYADLVISGRAPDPELGRTLFDQLRLRNAELAGVLEELRSAARERLEQAAAFLLGVGIAIAVVLALLLLAAAIGLRRAVLTPISALALQVRDVVTGGVQSEVHASGPREIVELGEDVEAMRVHILRDLDDAQEVSRRLDEQAQELERSNRDLEQFAYVASHDLQEPLRKVASFCQLLQRRYGGQLDERADQYIEFAVDGASRMQRLINDLLAFSRVGRTTEGFLPVDLGATAAAVAAQLEAARAEVDGEIVVGTLPEVSGDPGLLRQLLVNLIGNSLKFRRDGVPPVVRIDAHRSGADWEITVADNGIGIDDAYADKVFVIFQRLHARDRYPGTGIGLALAKKIVEFHGGRIWLVPGLGDGAGLRFTLPVRVPAPDPPESSTTRPTPSAATVERDLA